MSILEPEGDLLLLTPNQYLSVYFQTLEEEEERHGSSGTGAAEQIESCESRFSWILGNFCLPSQQSRLPCAQCSSHNPSIFISKRHSIDNTVSLIIIAGSCTLYCYLVHAFCGHESIIWRTGLSVSWCPVSFCWCWRCQGNFFPPPLYNVIFISLCYFFRYLCCSS